MAARRSLLILFVTLSGWLPVDAQTVTGRYRNKAKRPAPRAAVAYHSGMCRGLARCKHGVSQVSVAQARNRGYVPCKNCY